jgi:hypothetical protein
LSTAPTTVSRCLRGKFGLRPINGVASRQKEDPKRPLDEIAGCELVPFREVFRRRLSGEALFRHPPPQNRLPAAPVVSR